MMVLMMQKDVITQIKESVSVRAHCVSGTRNVHVVASVGLECRLLCIFVLRPLLTGTLAAAASRASFWRGQVSLRLLLGSILFGPAKFRNQVF